MPLEISNFPSGVVDALAWPFDFAIKEIAESQLWFSVRPAMSLTPIAEDGTGGIYASLDRTGEVLFVDSEGSGSIVAPNLESLLLILVCHPYWRDLLKFSGGGNLHEMRRTLPFAEHDYFEDEPQAIGLGAKIRTELHLPNTRDMVDVLHASVVSSGQQFQLFAPDGSQLTSLFKKFTAMDNPTWRKRAEPGAPSVS